MSRRGGIRATEFEERDYYASPRRSAPDLEERRRTVTISEPREDRTPAFLREDTRRTEAGPMVLRSREVETVDRHHPRSPSPVRVREERLVRRPRSISPSIHETERSRSRVIEKERIREPRRSPSPRVVRYVQQPKPPSPVEHESERIRTRIVERDRAPSPPPVPKPSPPPTTIKGPTIEREVITHWRDIDHGVVRAPRPRTPPPPRAPSRVRERETDIDITLSKNKTEVDVDIQRSTSRSMSHERRSPNDETMILRRETDRVRFDDAPAPRRRAHSAAPTPSAVDEEGDYLTSKLDSRGRMGEAWGGATKDWTMIDVPPGTERIRMDGIGGGSTDTSFTRYSGVRRSKFIPERDGEPAPREASPPPSRERDRVNVAVYDREREVEVEKVTDRRVSRPAPPPKDMWTEITKDLVVREAIEEMNYDYEETKDFFYIMDYLRYDDVLQLVDISDEIRRARRNRTRELEWEREREYQEDFERHRSRHYSPRWDEVVERERELIYDRPGPRGYLRG